MIESFSENLLQMLKAYGIPCKANDNISTAANLTESEIADIQDSVEEACQNLLRALVIDTENDHNSRETAHRMAKMFVREVFKGRYLPMPDLKDFPNAMQLDTVYVVGPITIRSACSHHFVPIMGKAWVGVLPGERVVGLSKFSRLADWVFSRPQIQEEATVQLADLLEKAIHPRGLALIVDAQHMCMTWRGVKESETTMTTSIMRGVFRDDARARSEFLELVKLRK